MSEPHIITLVGISGVGKTTFLKKLSLQFKFQHLTAGSLITRARDAGERPRDDLRLADLDENQRLLVESFHLACDNSASHIILDGHCIIHGDLGVQYIDSRVFSELGVKRMAHLEADTRQIEINRAGDPTRPRPTLELDDLRIHQLSSLEHARVISSKLGIPFQRLKKFDLKAFVTAIS
jgi:adenylate kinase